MSFLKLIVGLGNPGRDYSETRHNVGFRVIDTLHEKVGSAASWQEKGKMQLTEVMISGEKTKLLKPQSYMNNSGEPVSELMRFYKIEPAEILVIHDEIDLPFGKLRLKAGGGDAGNNGLRSITASLGTADYLRLRVGVGKPENAEYEIASWVLSKFSPEEREKLPDLLKQACGASLDLAEHGLKHAQNRFNC